MLNLRTAVLKVGNATVKTDLLCSFIKTNTKIFVTPIGRVRHNEELRSDHFTATVPHL